MILIAGPCVIESESQINKIAEELVEFAEDPQIDFYFKASYDKANRTSLESYRGPGLKEGLRILENVKERFKFKILTDVHETSHVKPAAEVADALQIPAFLCRQTDLLVEAAKTNKIVNIKKGQFMNPEDMQYSVLKVLKTKNSDIEKADFETSKNLGVWLTERGSSFGYGNLVVDMRGLLIMRKFAPVIFDATHSVQMPGGAQGKSSGKREYVAPLAKAAAAVGCDGFFFETHYDPDNALSDGPNMITTNELKNLVRKIKNIKKSAEEI